MSPGPRPLRVALLGSRGIPAAYGGYETLMEELASRLVRMEEPRFEVTVYCRSHYTPRELREYAGVRLVVLPTLRTKHLDTPVHTLLSCLDAAHRPFDAALLVNSANALFVPLLKTSEIPVALHVDGIEKQRSKWGGLGRLVYSLSERLACRWPDVVVSDAEVIRRHYRDRYGCDSWQISYGVDVRPVAPGEVLERLGLRSGSYLLYVSRFEPENNPHRVVEAYRRVNGDHPLVMVGGAPYAGRFIRGFRERADSRVLFPGPIYGDGYRELLSNALAYIHATEVGGTHPALVEAMGYGNCVLVNGTEENREVAGDAGLFFDAHRPDTLAELLREILDRPEERRRRGREAAERARRLFSWDGVARDYARLFTHLSRRGE